MSTPDLQSHKPSTADDPWTGEKLVVLMFGTLAVAFTILYIISMK